MKLRSSISSSLKRYMLMRGSAIASVGALMILFSGMFIPAAKMAYWGLPIFALGVGMITLGLLPYRRLCRLENKPRELILTDSDTLEFVVNSSKVLTIPMASVAEITHIDKDHDYGIAIVLKETPPEKITIHNPALLGICHGNVTKERYHCDLYFRFFSRRAYEMISNFTIPHSPVVHHQGSGDVDFLE